MLQQWFSLGELYSQLKQLNSSQDGFTGLYALVEYSYASIIQIRSLKEFSLKFKKQQFCSPHFSLTLVGVIFANL